MRDQHSNMPRGQELVLTPGGRRSRDQVRVVRPGEAVRVDDGESIIPRGRSTELIRERTPAMRGNLVLTPGGHRHPSLVHRVESGYALDAGGGKLRLRNLSTEAFIDIPEVKAQPGDVPGFGSGWIAYAYWINATGHPISSFRTTWQVPTAPTTHSGQTIFLFNGIDPSNPSSGILQPVLQWGPSAAGGGSYWSVASWYVSGDGNAFHTAPVQVNVGDTLVGSMTLTSQSGSNFTYNCEFLEIAGTSLAVQNLPQLVWSNETLEAYSITQCSDYPASTFTALRSIQMQAGSVPITLNWTPVNNVTDCGQHAMVVSNSATEGEVDIYYRAQAFHFPFDVLAQEVRILFGVTNDGGGIVILPNGRIIHIPPGDPAGPLFLQIAEGIAEVGRGFAVREIIEGSTIRSSNEAISRASLELMGRALENAAQAVKSALTEVPI